MNKTIEHRLMLLLKKAFVGLNVDISDETCQQLAELIHQAMDHKFRVYHTSAHIFDLCIDMKPRQILAALFHDIIYYQLDSLSSLTFFEPALKSIGHIEQGSLKLTNINLNDTTTSLCTNLFDFKNGDCIPMTKGVNEFLSAILVTQQLQAYLDIKHLLAIAAMIEATIPFRGRDSNGVELPELLAKRIRLTALLHHIELSERELEDIVIDAVVLANQDVAGFSTPDPNYFLSTTWLLIDEANTAFKKPDEYTIQDYRKALLNMEMFFLSLDSNSIFHRYQNTPDEHEFNALQSAAQKNIAFALDYIGTKIAGIAVVEALALLTGGDCPIAEMLGKIDEHHKSHPTLQHQNNTTTNDNAVNPELLNILVSGRSRASKYDLNESPITAYMCQKYGQTRVLNISLQAKQMFAGEISAQQFLNSLDLELVKTVVNICAKTCCTRLKKLQTLSFFNDQHVNSD